jgi:hypothetical protein
LENTLVTKSEEAIAGYFSWQKLLRKARAHAGCRANDDDDDEKAVRIVSVRGMVRHWGPFHM